MNSFCKKNLAYLILMLIASSYSLLAQISPGELTKAHAELEGLSNCTKCHVLGEKVTNQKCLDCHKEITSLVKASRGYHSSSDVKGKDCFKCHSEHHGRNFQIVKFDEKNFGHAKAGYELKGAHAEAKCEDCHASKNISNEILRLRKKTFLGLEQNCASCHEDFHQKTLGEDCGSCHLTIDFNEAEKFEHNNARYRLTGAHQNVDCNSCHKTEQKNGKKFKLFRGVKYAACVDCHKDAHNGKFGNDCAKCHSTSSFKQINEKGFDHSKTNFALIGLHKKVECKECHKDTSTKKLKYEKCNDCHKDYHLGEFDIGLKKRDCVLCHDEYGFAPSSYSIEKHQTTKFPLSGAHFAVPCRECHFSNEEEEHKFKFEKLECIVCHENIHREELRKDFLKDNGCEECHSTESWKAISFNHEKTKYQLIGKHRIISCSDCHLSKEQPKKHLFMSVMKECSDCHLDIHNKQFIVEGKTECKQCHDSNSWFIEKFNHDSARFKLEGTHLKVDCVKCHRQEIINTKPIVIYKFEDISCKSCHQNEK